MCLFQTPWQDYQFCIQVGGIGWKVIIIFVSFPSDLFFLVFLGENFSKQSHAETLRGGLFYDLRRRQHFVQQTH